MNIEEQLAMNKFYAGIGARKTPVNVLEVMTQLAACLERDGWTLRSGGANGADTAFERGVVDPANKEIFLPWRGFNGSDSPLCEITSEAYAMAEQFHPAWERCSSAARKFHARNCFQALGATLQSPCSMIVCWTPDALMTGGTGQALRIAQHNDICIKNLADATQFDKVVSYIAMRELDNISDTFTGVYVPPPENI
jgi:hypothetical protein